MPERKFVSRAKMLEQLCSREDLTREATTVLFQQIVAGELDPLHLSAILIGLKAKGESPCEIAGAASALRDGALKFEPGLAELADCCGTGGDGQGSVNISTAAALIAAAGGIPMVKHGNRSISSRCGSADVLEASGVKVEQNPEVARRCLTETGICFLFAPFYHPGMRHAMPVRRALAVRTIFNILGPLANPGRPTIQLVGVYDRALCKVMAQTLQLLGCRSALVVHGSSMDEIAIHGETSAVRLCNGSLEEMTIVPEDAGFTRHPIESLQGGDACDNARWLKELLAGQGRDAHTQAVALNAGGLLWIAGKAQGFKEGCELAREILRSGQAADTLRRFAECSHHA